MIRDHKYLKISSSVPFSLLATTPLVVGYYVLLLLSGAQFRNLAEAYLLSLINGRLDIAFGVFIAVQVGSLVYVATNGEFKGISVSRYLAATVLESSVWAFIIWFVVSVITGAVLDLSAGESITRMGILDALALSMGAGIFEEVLFRVIIQGALFLMLFKLFGQSKRLSITLAVFFSAILFSLSHHIGVYGEAFTMSAFLFRFLFGLSFSGLIAWRGFAVTTWTHALYDIAVLL